MDFQEIGKTIQTFINDHTAHVAMSLIVFIAFWIGAKLLHALILRICAARKIDIGLSGFLARAAKVSMLLFGAVTALGTLGINVSALVAGLGLTGFALGFALKDIVSNSLAGILIIIYKPFQHGDHIKVAAFEGEVTMIDLRYTVLDAESGRIFVPNSMLFNNAVTVGKKATA